MLRQVLPMILLLAPTVALAQPEPKVLVATGKETTKVVSLGGLICEGGQPTGFPAPMCSPGTKRILMRDSIQESTWGDVTGRAAASFGGKSTIIIQRNFDDTCCGFCWDALENPVPELGGKWEGSWSGVFDYAVGTAYVSGEACGYGGQLEGLRAKFEQVSPGARLG